MGAGNMGSMMSGMGTQSASGTGNSTFQGMIISFFSDFWGTVILLVSFVSIIAGMWFSNNRKLIPMSIAGSLILYISMYVYFSIILEITGIAVLAFVYISIFSSKVARVL